MGREGRAGQIHWSEGGERPEILRWWLRIIRAMPRNDNELQDLIPRASFPGHCAELWAFQKERKLNKQENT